MGTAGVSEDGKLYVDPAIIEGPEAWGHGALCGLLEHEVWHLLLRHAERAELQGVDRTTHPRWNIAADAEIHDGHVTPESMEALDTDAHKPITPVGLDLPEGHAAEWYYHQLEDHVIKVSCRMTSASDGVPKGYEEGADGDPNVGKWSDAERAEIERTVAQAIQQQKQRGDLPAGMERWAAERLADPVVPWRTLLRRAVQTGIATHGASDYCYSRLSRRDPWGCRGYYSPGMITYHPTVAAVIDTSGSVSPDGLSHAVSETIALSRAARGDCWAASCDAEASTWRRVRTVNDVNLVGGGGTDMRTGIASALRDLPTKPSVIIVITDGETPWPDEPVRGVTVIAVIVSTSSDFERPPSWITTIQVDEVGT